MKHADIISKLSRRQKANLLTGKDFWSTLPIENAGIPSAYLADGPHGIRKQAAASDHLGLNASIPATCFPTAAGMANSWNPQLGEEMGRALGEEAAAQNVNVLLGPGTNIKRNPLCGRNFEYFSEDPYLAGKMAASYIKGIQSNGISACIKHFALNSQENRRMVIDSVADERTIREICLTAFEIAVKEGHTRTLMSSYNKVNGEYANENPHLMQDILRGEWGYDGVVVTDWGGCNDRVKGLECGNELEMPACVYGADDIYKAMEEGTLAENLVDENLDRLIDLILTTDAAVKTVPETFDVNAHHNIARRCAEEAMVLLKNDENVLPLYTDSRVCFIGSFAGNPRFQGAGSSIVNPTMTETFLDEVRKYNFHFTGYAEGFKRYGGSDRKLAEKAVTLAASSDIIIFFAGLDELSEAEGIDRKSMKLPDNQLSLFAELKKLGKKIVTVLFCGSPVEMDIIEQSDAIVHAYLAGQAAPTALLNILSGRTCPSGKLAESYPYRYEDCSTSHLFHADDFISEYRESIYIGYRYYDTAGINVRYPFGYGLSYTTFEYRGLRCDENGAVFTIKNTGKHKGAETAQLYIRKESDKIFRPAKELKGFIKIFLEPGEEKEVFIPFDSYSFRVYNSLADEWQTESGDYDILIGASSRDIRLNDTVYIQGNDTTFYENAEALKKYFDADVKNISREEFESLLGRKVVIPEYNYVNRKNTRIEIGLNNTVTELKYSRSLIGRVFSGGINTAHKVLWKTGKRTTANTLEMGMVHQPMRALAKFGGMSQNQLDGMLLVFNGNLMKGLKKFLSKQK
ncbi:MAG: glycoside hydrolase family 3 C-terminal domain-containing protein [Parasporobacterium sp.]|nr:glycoside hydrolase family 3 C-terminal domain-containing protein [Parasporobacterium sp.]